jgi:hypothetical protein
MSQKRDSLPPKTQAAFLAALAETGNVRQACRSIGRCPATIYKYRQKDPAFAAQWDETMALAMDTVLEAEAIRRAVDGVEKPVYHQGQVVGTVREYSDTLLIFLLKGWKSDRYRERREVFHRGAVALLQKFEQIGAMDADELQRFLQDVEAYTNGLAQEGRP